MSERIEGVKPLPRWNARFLYCDGTYDDVPFEEFVELGRRVEGGVDWRLIEAIQVTLAAPAPIGRKPAGGCK